jgi:hypothetical protein
LRAGVRIHCGSTGAADSIGFGPIIHGSVRRTSGAG